MSLADLTLGPSRRKGNEAEEDWATLTSLLAVYQSDDAAAAAADDDDDADAVVDDIYDGVDD